MKEFLQLPKLAKGDKVSIVASSGDAAARFPWVYQKGLQQLQSVFGLEPIEYPLTRELHPSLQTRAKHIMDAFADPHTKAVIATIGGIDQIQLLKYLDKEVFLNNPKPFFGFSDNTHLINYLWNLGIPSYYGGSIMTQYAFHGGVQPFTEKFLRLALFEKGEFELTSSEQYNDIGLNWADQSNTDKIRIMEPNEGWYWDGKQNAAGVLWGGCVESLVAQLGTNKYLPNESDLQGSVLFLETSEEIPDPWIVMYVLIAMGERGWFNKFQAVLVGRPKAWEFNKPKTTEQKDTYRAEQRQTVINTIRAYNSSIPIVQNLNFGHTDPQIALPVGQSVRVDTASKRIFANF